MKVSRRRFVGSSAGAMIAAGLGAEARAMLLDDVPASPNFSALPLKGNSSWEKLAESNVSDLMKAAARRAPRGSARFWGLPFQLGPSSWYGIGATRKRRPG
jgi:hypothetical protein